MGRVRLNAVAIREARLPAKAPPPSTSGSLASLAPDSLLVTRREAVAIAGIAAAAVAGATGAVPALGALGPVTVSATARRARFAAGSLAFVLDPTRFGGTPKLKSTTGAAGVSAALSGARFAGTELPADMTFETIGVGVATRLRIRTKLGGFDAEVPLAKWLAGEAKATSAVRFSGESCPLKGLSALKLSGAGTATFGADWSIRIEGANIARVTGLGSGVVGDTVTISLPAENVPTVFSRKIKRRTLVTIERGTHEWTLTAPSGNGAGGIALAKDAFDSLTLEAAETADGYPYRAVIAQSSSADAKATFAAKALRGVTGKAAAVPLAALRYARAFDSDGDSFVLAADFPARGTWLHGPGYALLVGAGASAAPFQMSGAGHVADTIVCQPSVQALSVPMGDAIVEPIRFPEDGGTTIKLGNAAPSAKPMKAQAVGIDPSIIIIDPGLIVLPAASAVTVTRPEDMLRLRFEFYNVALSFTSGTPKLVRRSRAVSTTTLVVVFQPQHILETAFNEFAALPTGPGEATATPPIWSTIASESRLAFAIPAAKADAGIPYTLAGLLDWSSYDMRVVPLATAGSLAVPRPKGLDPRESENNETALEVPWGLYLSPSERARWSHATQAVGKNDVYELWHTRYVGDYVPFIVSFSASSPEDGSVRAAAAVSPIVVGPISRPAIGTYVRLGLNPPRLRATWARFYGQWQANINDGNDANNMTLPASVASELARRTAFSTPTEPTGFRNRWGIVDITARQRMGPVDVRRLMLTSQGAWMNVIGNWTTDEQPWLFANPKLLGWEHRMTQGRDHYVKIIEAGRLFPFGHKALQITVTERKFKPAPGTGRSTAYLLQRTFIIVREPIKTYGFADFPGKPVRARQTPFKRVEIKTHITPPLHIDNSVYISKPYAYWTKIAEISSHPDVMYQIEATDWDGALVTFEAPLIFVADEVAAKKIPSTQGPTTVLGSCAFAYRAKDIKISGQKIAYAEPLPASATKDTRHLPTDSVRFTAETIPPTADLAFNTLLFYPKLYTAKVRLDIAEQITNQTAAATITLAGVYLNNGYSGANAKGMAFANVNPKMTSILPVTPGLIDSLDDGGLPLPFPGSQAGGLATPSSVIKGLSAFAGPFGGAVDAFAGGFGNGTDFNAGDFFGSLLEAKLIGGVKLIDLLTKALGLDDIPGFTKRIEETGGEKKLIVAFDWNVDNSSKQKIKKFFIFEPTNSTALKLKAEMTKSLTNLEAEPTSVIEGSLSDFYINLIGDSAEFLNLVFGTFSFSSINGGSPKINPGLEDVLFAGPLQFLNELRQFLGVFGGKGPTAQSALAEGSPTSAMALGSFNIGPFLVEFDTTGLYISISIAIPNISVGVMALSNMSLGAKISLLWDGSPILVDFNFCTKESQMTISVCGWAGGGYVLLKLATGDPVLRMLEIGFWFGASASIDVGVASGSVEIKGGFIFTIENEVKDGKTIEKLKFEAYIRLSGRLDILGIIKVSLTFELVLTYEQFTKGSGKGDKLTGTATLTIEIEILFFSFSVDASVTQEIAGKDPRFGETYDEADWIVYCKAFAPATLGA